MGLEFLSPGSLHRIALTDCGCNDMAEWQRKFFCGPLRPSVYLQCNTLSRMLWKCCWIQAMQSSEVGTSSRLDHDLSVLFIHPFCDVPSIEVSSVTGLGLSASSGSWDRRRGRVCHKCFANKQDASGTRGSSTHLPRASSRRRWTLSGTNTYK